MGWDAYTLVKSIMIVLTGASGGIGGAILLALAALDDVIAIYRRTPPTFDGKPNIVTYQLDLTSEVETQKFAASMKKSLRQITVVHAAAVKIDGLAAQYSTQDWEAVMDVNLRGNFFLTRELLSPMISDKWGRVIHLSAIAGMRAAIGGLAYSTSKTGLLGMSRTLAQEYARFGITSNVLVLGYFNVGMYKVLSEKIRKDLLQAIPSGRLGDPSNIVHAIEFLMKSSYVNGTAIQIDGGL